MSSIRRRVGSLPARPKERINHTPQLLGSNESIIDCEDEEKVEEFFNDVYGGGDESLEMSVVISPVDKEKKKKKKKGEPTAPGQHMIDYIKKHKAATTVDNLAELTAEDTAVEDVKYADAFMMTPLHYAAWYCTPSLISHMLNKWSADCTAEEENGLLPFHYAIASDCIESCAMFIEKDTTLTKATAKGAMTSLHIAAIAGSVKVASELIMNSAEVDARNTQGHTPLALACRWSKVGVTSVLLDHGADCTIGANDGTTPLFFSTVYCRSVLPKMLDTLYDVDLDRMSENLYLGDLSMKFNYKDNKFWHFSQLKWLALDKNMDIIMHPVVMRLVEIKYKKFATRRIMWTYGLNLLYAISITATFIMFGNGNDATSIALCEETGWQDYLGIIFSMAAGVFASLIFITYLYTILNVKAAVLKEASRVNTVMRNTALHYKFCHHKKVPKLSIVPKSKKISRQALAMNGYIMIMIQSMIGSVMAIAIIVLGVIMVATNSTDNCEHNTTANITLTKKLEKIFVSSGGPNSTSNSTNNSTDIDDGETIEQRTIDFFTSNFMRFCALAMLHAWFNLMANLRYTFLPISKLIITLTYVIVDIFQFIAIFMLIFIPFCIIAKVQYFASADLEDVTMSVWRMSLVDGDLYDDGLKSQKDSESGEITNDMMYGKSWWQFLCVVYVFSVAVILINILIAMLSTTFQRVQDDSKAMSMLDKISYVGMIEMTRSDNTKKSDDKEIVKKHNPDVVKLDEMSERFRATMADLDNKRTSEVLIQNSILKDRVEKLERRNAKLKRASTKVDDASASIVDI